MDLLSICMTVGLASFLKQVFYNSTEKSKLYCKANLKVKSRWVSLLTLLSSFNSDSASETPRQVLNIHYTTLNLNIGKRNLRN